jgi:hypothetical protein
MYDMSHIRGDEIVNGNPEHCINLLQILQQISSASMMQDEDSSKNQSPSQQQHSASGKPQRDQSPPGGSKGKASKSGRSG